MMITAPTIVAIDGTSPNTTKPKITAQTIIEYWYGTTTLAGASFSDRLTQNSAVTEMHPASAKNTRLPGVGGTQWNADSTAPSENVPMNCEDAITMSGVLRRLRVISIRVANDRLPPSAISAGRLTVCADGRSAISTPQKPIRIAVQRRQPTFSPRKIADIAVTKMGPAR